MIILQDGVVICNYAAIPTIAIFGRIITVPRCNITV